MLDRAAGYIDSETIRTDELLGEIRAIRDRAEQEREQAAQERLNAAQLRNEAAEELRNAEIERLNAREDALAAAEAELAESQASVRTLATGSGGASGGTPGDRATAGRAR